MKKKQFKFQLSLILIGTILFVITYLYYPNLNNKNQIDNKVEATKIEKNLDDKEHTSFNDLEYQGLYDIDKPFKIKSSEAYVLNEEPDIVYMKNMHVFLYLADDRVVEITSLKGRYNKSNYDCFFEDNVYAIDKDTVIKAENLDLLATENFVKIYNNVNLDNPTGSLKADKIDYDFETKNFKVSMYDDSEVEMKVIK